MTGRYRIVLLFVALFLGLLYPPDSYGADKDQLDLAQGKLIRNVTIQIDDIFENPDNAVYRTANELKIQTQQEVIRRELLFKEGEPLDPFVVRESIRVLRSLRYLRHVDITPTIDGDSVDLNVVAQDTWTIIPQIDYSSGDGRDKRAIGLAEKDLLGFGKRAELLYLEEEGRESLEAVYEDPRLWGSRYDLLLGYFDRNDGDRAVFSFGDPLRSLLDESAWKVTGDTSDTIGRLFEGGDEFYIFREDFQEFQGLYTISRGDPKHRRRRISFGYRYESSKFEAADENDLKDLDLDPDRVSIDPALLAENRRYSGPMFSYELVEPDYVSMNYIDRFSRVADYNLGWRMDASLHLAPEALGSRDDAAIMSIGAGNGGRFSDTSFLRAEVGAGGRYEDGSFENSLIRTEARYYNVIGDFFLRDIFVGKHTLASAFFLDYGHDLDQDRQLTLGGDIALRGYDSRTFNGDKRYALNIEDRVHLVEDWLDLISFGTAFFAEVGGATDESLSKLVTDESYADLGFGLRFAFPRSSGERVLRIDLAVPMRDGPDGTNDFEIRVVFAGGQLFSSYMRGESSGAEEASVGVGFDR